MSSGMLQSGLRWYAGLLVGFGAVCAGFGGAGFVSAEEHQIRPGDSPQAVLDRAAPGDRLVFLPGLHQHAPGKHRAILYVDRAIDIELQEGRY